MRACARVYVCAHAGTHIHEWHYLKKTFTGYLNRGKKN